MKTFTNPVAHVYKEANSCADKLARMGADPILDYLFLYDSPACGGWSAGYW